MKTKTTITSVKGNMCRTSKRSLLLVVMLIIALVFIACGNNDETASSEETTYSEETTSAAVEPVIEATDEPIIPDAKITDEALSIKDNTSEDDSNRDSKKDKASNNNDNKSSDNKSKDKPKSSKDSNKPKQDTKKDSKNDSKNDSKKDKDKQKPADDTIKCTISIDCLTLFNKDPDLANKFSNKGIMLGKKTLSLKKNATVYDALKASGVSFVGKKYISQINGLSEKDAGKLSGWVFYVNGEYSTVSCEDYKLKKGDDIRWRYTCNNGSDL